MIATSSLNMVNSVCHPLGGWCDANALLLIPIRCSNCLQMTMGANRLMKFLEETDLSVKRVLKEDGQCCVVVVSQINLRRSTSGETNKVKLDPRAPSLHGSEVVGNGRQDCCEMLFKR